MAHQLWGLIMEVSIKLRSCDVRHRLHVYVLVTLTRCACWPTCALWLGYGLSALPSDHISQVPGLGTIGQRAGRTGPAALQSYQTATGLSGRVVEQ
jgi:hypothetical protein